MPLRGRRACALRREQGAQDPPAKRGPTVGRPGEPPPPPICPERKGIRGIGSLGAAPSPFRSSSGYRPGLLPKICMRLLRVSFRGPSQSGPGASGRTGNHGGRQPRGPPAAVSPFSRAFKKRWKLDPSRRRPRPAGTDGRTARPGPRLALRRAVSGSQQQADGRGRGAPGTGAGRALQKGRGGARGPLATSVAWAPALQFLARHALPPAPHSPGDQVGRVWGGSQRTPGRPG